MSMASVRLAVTVGLSSMFRPGVMPSKPVSLLNWQMMQPTLRDRTWEVMRYLAPRGQETLADQLIARNATEAEARQAFLAELAKAAAPAGTPEPPAAEKAAAPGAPPKLADVPDDVLVRSVCG